MHNVLLSTAIVHVYDTRGVSYKCRLLLDNASQTNFITENLAAALKLQRRPTHISVMGISGNETYMKHIVSTSVKSLHSSFTTKLSFLVTPKIGDYLPAEVINQNQLAIPGNLPLADPHFHIPAPVDMLLGAEIYYWLLCDGKIVLSDQLAIAQKTRLGWVISGKVDKTDLRTSCYLTSASLQRQLETFWNIEDDVDSTPMSPAEIECENHFQTTTTRRSDGRFIVRMPFNEKLQQLGDSRTMASRRFFALERRLKGNSTLQIQYNAFLTEYLQLNHMKEVHTPTDSGYYLPHHAVLKDTSLTTKLRVVFDGSAKTTTGLSLNNTLLVGPKIQEDIFSIVLRFRTHKYVLTADIEKMYRQIMIHPEESRYQRILWRFTPEEPLKTYELQTVTYGLASAPYLAVRCLHQLADEEGKKYPHASAVIKRDFYVDDLLTGANSLKDAKLLQGELRNLLQLGGFNLRKWSSNEPSLINTLDQDSSQNHLTIGSETIKTLGVQWDSQRDVIVYSVNTKWNNKPTKRNILSYIAQLFDPLGLLGPVIIKAKMIMQQLWLLKIDWDDIVTDQLQKLWTIYVSELQDVKKLAIPRNVTLLSSEIEMHGFCDASERAYGACIYLRSVTRESVKVALVCAKARVAPLKTQSLPRLELCAAVLLSTLAESTKKSLNIQISKSLFWSDSTIALQWIRTSPHLLKTFVANRVAEIQRKTDNNNWRHVPTEHNPADLISRGCSVNDLVDNQLWHHGPQWLSQPPTDWPSRQFYLETVPETRTTTNSFASFAECTLLTRYSSITRLMRIIAYCFRFKNRCLRKDSPRGTLTTSELRSAMNRILVLTQKQEFHKEFQNLENNAVVSKDSVLRSLNPFLDSNGLLRVGGRLSLADIPYEAKHPVILPRKHHITHLILKNEHLRQWHSGTQATLHAVRRLYWPIDGKNTIRRIIHQCMRCFKSKPKPSAYMMGNVPQSRLIQARPFTNCGVDYCGPFFIKEKQYRNRQKVKVYVAIFVCFVTKAIHIELASDLTSDAFLACLRRFISRRGKPHNIHSDNGKNFVGAQRELAELTALLSSEAHNAMVADYLTLSNINWHFIPPRSPHFGGLWEAAVKSFKTHLRRVIGDTLLTFEQLSTYTTEIEAVLNSRPLTPLSTDPNDLLALTPGHFLIGDALLSIPDHEFTDIPTRKLSTWQHLQKLKQHFWKRWHKEYLHELNQRSKWQQKTSNIKIGTMVVLHEDNLAPMHWPLGRVTSVFPGSDNIVRVVMVKTSSGTYKRNVRSISPLPIEEQE